MYVERGQKSDQGRRGIQIGVGDPQMESGVHLTVCVCVLWRDEHSVSLVCWRFSSTCGGRGPLCSVLGPVGKSDVRKISCLLQELKV